MLSLSRDVTPEKHAVIYRVVDTGQYCLYDRFPHVSSWILLYIEKKSWRKVFLYVAPILSVWEIVFNSYLIAIPHIRTILWYLSMRFVIYSRSRRELDDCNLLRWFESSSIIRIARNLFWTRNMKYSVNIKKENVLELFFVSAYYYSRR